jgi:hypothetical protein
VGGKRTAMTESHYIRLGLIAPCVDSRQITWTVKFGEL